MSQRVSAGALRDWRQVVGEQHVVVEGDAYDAAQRTTFRAGRASSVVIRPATREEVGLCLRIAARHGVTVHPVSRGRNWGYGSRVPPQDGSALMALDRLDRIVGFSEELAYVVIEPGVTFKALEAFLRRQGSELLPPSIGGGADGSVVGNLLQRGIGKGPYESMASLLLGCEAALGDGRIVDTQLDGLPWRGQTPGPGLEGLFYQGGIGIVTRATIELRPASRLWQVGTRPVAGLDALVETVRPLLQRRGPALQIEVVNATRFLSQGLERPEAPWWVAAMLQGDDEQELAEGRRKVEARLDRLEWDAPEAPRRGADMEGLRSAYWRKPRKMPGRPDLDRDRCGVVWVAPVLPLLGGVVAEAMAQVDARARTEGIEPSISLRFLDGRSIHAVIGLFYDRDEPGGDDRALACHAALRDVLDRRRLFPYRLGLLDRDVPVAYRTFHEDLLRPLDPGGVLFSP